MTPEERTRAARAVATRMESLGLDTAGLARQAEVDRKTVRLLLAGTRWPTLGVRSRIEHALDWQAGELPRQARDGLEALAGFSDGELLNELLARTRRRQNHRRAVS